MSTSREFMGQGGIEMNYRCRDCGAEQLHVLPNQLNQRCLLCDFGLPAVREPWLTTVSASERQLALQQARELRLELDQRVVESAKGVNALSVFERQFWAVGCLFEAVHDGGFEQFFLRYASKTYAEALRGLDAMGAYTGFSLIGKARMISTGGADLPEDADARRILLAANWNPAERQYLDKLRRQFCSDTEDIEALWYEFALQHGLILSPV